MTESQMLGAKGGRAKQKRRERQQRKHSHKSTCAETKRIEREAHKSRQTTKACGPPCHAFGGERPR